MFDSYRMTIIWMDEINITVDVYVQDRALNYYGRILLDKSEADENLCADATMKPDLFG